MRAVVTGATGFIGRQLVSQLAEPAVVSRDAERARRTLGNVRAFSWNPGLAPAPADAFFGSDGEPVEVVFHLAGESVAEGRWNAEKKVRILESRVAGTQNLLAGLQALPRRPRVLVAASAVGYYGARGEALLDETAAPGTGFLADVCRRWEAESMKAEALGMRVALLRIGVVLGEGGGALGSMETPFKLGLGGPIGDGKQWMPWVHADDIVGLLLHLATSEGLRGPVNGVAPAAVRNRDFTRALGAALHRPAILPIPALALRIAFGEIASVLLASQHVVPRVAEASGYRFRYPTLDGALEAVYRPLGPLAP